jgi:hypothetical protein
MRLILITLIVLQSVQSFSQPRVIVGQENEMTQNEEQSCIVGSPKIRTYADQMTKPNYTENHSFLKEYWRHRVLSLAPAYLNRNPFVERISKDKIMCSIQNIPYVLTTKMICGESDQQGRYTNETPCVTPVMVDYIYWGVNEAMRCFSDYMDEHVQNIIFHKIHLESSFGFFFKYSGGTGLMQLVSASKDGMYKDGQSGHEFLKNHVATHPQQCSSFVELMQQSDSAKKLFNCDFISIGDGIGRNLLGGIGLYIYYRSAPNNPYSAEKILSAWGYENTHSNFYYRVRASIASGMYNKGLGAVYNEIHRKFAEGSLAKLPELERYKRVMGVVDHSQFAGYLKDMEASPAAIFTKGQCTIGKKPTFDGLAYQHSEPPLSSLLTRWGEHGTSAQYLRWKH